MSRNWKLYLHEVNYLVLGEGFAYTSPITPIQASNVSSSQLLFKVSNKFHT